MKVTSHKLILPSVLIFGPDGKWVDEIGDIVTHEEIKLNRLVATSRPPPILEIEAPDIIITQQYDWCRDWLNALIHISNSRPIVIIISDVIPADGRDFDVIISQNDLPALHNWLRSYIVLREEKDLLETQYKILQRKVYSLELELNSRQKFPADINLLKDSIVHSVTHELRTPMLQVKSAVALLAEEVGYSQKIMALALEATTRLEAGVRNVTLLNELMSESFETQSFNYLEVGQIVHAAIRNLQRSWERKTETRRIVVNIPNHIPLLWGDRQRLIIAIQLLLDNALKFSVKVVEVLVEGNDETITISIRDEGIGISEEHIPQICEPFYQIDSSSTRRYGGIGIGLAIVRYILEYHGTTLAIESTLGKGSTFAFSLSHS